LAWSANGLAAGGGLGRLAGGMDYGAVSLAVARFGKQLEGDVKADPYVKA